METEHKSGANAPKNASWGAILSIVVILAMIVIGATYSWDKRTDEQHAVTPPTSVTVSASSSQNQ